MIGTITSINDSRKKKLKIKRWEQWMKKHCNKNTDFVFAQTVNPQTTFKMVMILSTKSFLNVLKLIVTVFL